MRPSAAPRASRSVPIAVVGTNLNPLLKPESPRKSNRGLHPSPRTFLHERKRHRQRSPSTIYFAPLQPEAQTAPTARRARPAGWPGPAEGGGQSRSRVEPVLPCPAQPAATARRVGAAGWPGLMKGGGCMPLMRGPRSASRAARLKRLNRSPRGLRVGHLNEVHPFDQRAVA